MILACIATNLPLIIAFTESYSFGLCFIFFSHRYFLWLLDCLTAYVYSPHICEFSSFLLEIYILLHIIVVRKYA